MKSFDQLRNFKDLREQMKAFTEPASTRQATSRVSEILDAKYEKANLPSIVESATHLTTTQRAGLLKALQDYEELFDGTFGDWKTKPVSLKLKEGAKPYHGRPYPAPQKHLGPTKRDVERLVKIGVLKRQPDSEWASPAFIVPKKNQTVRSIADLRGSISVLFDILFRYLRYLVSLPSLGNSRHFLLCSVRGRLRIKITVYCQNSKTPKYLNSTTEDEAIQPVLQYNYFSFFLVDASTTTPINPGLQPENDLPHFLPYYSRVTVLNVSNSRRSFPASQSQRNSQVGCHR